MIDPVSFLVMILISLSLMHLSPRNRWSRLIWLTLPGLVLVFVVHPLALLFSFACFVFSTLVFFVAVITTSSQAKAGLPYLILFLLLVPEMIFRSSPVLLIGSAFFIVRQMMTVSSSIKKNVTIHDFIPALALATYSCASLPSGPIFDGFKVWDQLKQNSEPNYTEGNYRIFEGFVYLFAITGFIDVLLNDSKTFYSITASSNWVEIFLSYVIVSLLTFILLFCSFYGYSRVAEGSAMLFGFEVPQNFNKPHLARDIGDFWKRWHRSMADFVMQYLYLPLLVHTRRPKLALVLAFVFMGAWHELSAGYLFWGVCHGLALAIFLPWAQRKDVSPPLIRVLSIIYVVTLSSIAHGVF